MEGSCRNENSPGETFEVGNPYSPPSPAPASGRFNLIGSPVPPRRQCCHYPRTVRTVPDTSSGGGGVRGLSCLPCTCMLSSCAGDAVLQVGPPRHVPSTRVLEVPTLQDKDLFGRPQRSAALRCGCSGSLCPALVVFRPVCAQLVMRAPSRRCDVADG